MLAEYDVICRQHARIYTHVCVKLVTVETWNVSWWFDICWYVLLHILLESAVFATCFQNEQTFSVCFFHNFLRVLLFWPFVYTNWTLIASGRGTYFLIGPVCRAFWDFWELVLVSFATQVNLVDLICVTWIPHPVYDQGRRGFPGYRIYCKHIHLWLKTICLPCCERNEPTM